MGEHELPKFDGYISCLEERQERELKILKDLKTLYDLSIAQLIAP